MKLVDVVNFNADASCLTSAKWLNMLHGGENSALYRWLHLYVELEKKVVLGFPGGTVADIVRHSPDVIRLINAHPYIFEIILRPFAHDIALLRVGQGFQVNFALGRAVMEREFAQITPFFLPPEFMLNSSQVVHLAQEGVQGLFINPSRFPPEVRKRIPSIPYEIKGVFGTRVNCVPFSFQLTNAYLHALQLFDCGQWNSAIDAGGESVQFAWRDGESAFFLPDSLDRERGWLEGESSCISRLHLREFELTCVSSDSLEEPYYRSYPVHSFAAWMKELRMLGFIYRIADIERKLECLTQEQLCLWLATINSDILSAVEKKSPEVMIAAKDEPANLTRHVITRSERGFEGEEFLAALERSFVDSSVFNYLFNSDDHHLIKLMGRMSYVKEHIRFVVNEPRNLP